MYSFIIVQVALNIKKILKKIVQDYRLKKNAALGYVGWNFVSLYFKRYRMPRFLLWNGTVGAKEGVVGEKDESWGETEKKLWKAQEKKFKKGIAGDENFL